MLLAYSAGRDAELHAAVHTRWHAVHGASAALHKRLHFRRAQLLGTERHACSVALPCTGCVKGVAAAWECVRSLEWASHCEPRRECGAGIRDCKMRVPPWLSSNGVSFYFYFFCISCFNGLMNDGWLEHSARPLYFTGR